MLKTSTSIRFSPGFTCFEMSTRHGGATRMPASLAVHADFGRGDHVPQVERDSAAGLLLASA